MPLRFVKMHGLGNDYVFVDVTTQHVDDPASLARAISDRHRGVGSDGLILIAAPREAEAHARMVMYNADGSRAQMCGNGIRCLAKLVYESGLARVNPLRVETDHGVLTLDLRTDAAGGVAAVRVDMGPPVLEPARIPVMLPGPRVVARPYRIDGATIAMTCVSMGNPHAVFFADDLDAVPLASWGPRIECDPLFPERVNVHFVQVAAPGYVWMVTWERGAGPTQACGTGAAAVCVAGVLNGRTERAIVARLPGGELELSWDAGSDHVHMTGPAVEVFRGEWPM